MKVDLAITGGRVFSGLGGKDLNVLINGETITDLVRPGTEGIEANETIDASGLWVLPGMVDPHVHTREPGYTHKEDITTCSQASAAGGVTTIFGMPNLKPSTLTYKDLEDVLKLYAEKSVVDYNHNPVPTLGEVDAMAEAGIAAYKVFMVVDTGRNYPHPAGTGIHDSGHLLQMFEAVAKTGLRFMVHPHNQGVCDRVEQSFWERGDRSVAAYAKTLATHDGIIWDLATAELIRMSEATGCPLHIVHVQTSRCVEMLRQAKERGIKVTGEVNHWALFLGTWDIVTELGPYALSYWVPDHHREAIVKGLQDGIIDIVSSDHAPHTREEKEVGWTDMWAAHTGTPGIQFQYPLMLDAVHRGEFTIERTVEMVAEAPARCFKINDRKGSIASGLDADIVLVDPDKEWTITDDVVLSKIGWTPYNGRQCRGQILRTLLRGKDVYRDGRVVGEPGQGRQVTPN